jgi:hypothetical protein
MKITVATSIALFAFVAAAQAQNTCSCDPSDYNCLADCGTYLTMTLPDIFILSVRV